MDEREMRDRTKQLALRVLRLVESLPRNRAGHRLGDQILRSGTSVGANYRAVCRARSRADFIAKLAIVEEEADEICYWLEIMMEYGLVPRDRLEPLHREANEILAIVTASRLTATRNSVNSKHNRKSKI